MGTRIPKEGLGLIILILGVAIVFSTIKDCCERWHSIFSTSSSSITNTPPELTSLTERHRHEAFYGPGIAFIDGRVAGAVPPHTIKNISIYESVNSKHIVGKVKHGSKIMILQSEYNKGEGCYYYKVSSKSCKGWVREVYINSSYNAPVGAYVD